MIIFDIDACERKIGYVFKDKILLRKCFTHASYAYEHGEKDNELLEFFGDAIIQFVVTEYLYNHSQGDEGLLTKKRAGLVSKDPLLRAVERLGIGEFVLLGRGQKKTAKRDDKLFSSIYEALVAGIYLDGGMTAVKKFILNTIIADFIKEKIKKKVNPQTKSDAKNRLQEHVQKNKIGSIAYQTLWKKGPDHMPKFRVAVLLNGTSLAEGEGHSKKIAEANAAESALKQIKKQGGAKK